MGLTCKRMSGSTFTKKMQATSDYDTIKSLTGIITWGPDPIFTTKVVRRKDYRYSDFIVHHET